MDDQSTNQAGYSPLSMNENPVGTPGGSLCSQFFVEEDTELARVACSSTQILFSETLPFTF